MASTIRYLLSDLKHRTRDFFGELRHGPVIDLMESQWWSRDRLLELQNQRLRKVVQHAYAQLPGYRRKFDEHGVHPDDIHDISDLKKLPITDRHEVQNNPGFYRRRLINETLYTGGSTGTSLEYYESFHATKIRWAAHLRGWSWNGYRPGKRIAIISSSQGTLNKRNALNLYGDLTSENIGKVSESLRAFEPEYIRGYVSSLYLLARYLLERDIRIEGVRAIDPISENLYPYQRQLIEQAFGAKVFQEYCANDGGACGWECNQHRGVHYTMERAIIEEVDGELITTDLWNYAMPFIRYRNGDSLRFLDSPCRCGRELALIEVKGRDNDIIVTPAGPVSPSLLMQAGMGLGGGKFRSGNFRNGISAVQYVQKPGYRLLVNLVTNDRCDDTQIVQFTDNLKRILPGMQIELTEVDTIPATAKGKRHFVINEDSELLKTLRPEQRIASLTGSPGQTDST